MLHSLRRTLEIFGWVLLATSVIGLLVEWIGLTRIAAGTKRHPMLELLGTALFGLIPNCSASIAIAEGYLRGVLSFSAAVAGLSAGAGYGPILLLRRGLLAKGIRLMAICLAFSIAAGLAVRILELG
jgi:Putative, 10TM heavy-metal exporter